MTKIILYTLNCPICNKIKQMLDEKNIKYEVCDDEEEMERLGIEVVPVLSVDGLLMQAKVAMEYIRGYKE